MSSRRWPMTALAAVFLVASTGAAVSALEVPYLGGRVNDLADLLSPPAEARLDTRLAALEQATRSQVAVLTVPSLEGDPIEDFSIRVVETWKLGDADADNGVLFLIARDERQMRIEVGYGVEGLVPDILAVRILRELVEPRFQAGDFDGGVENGVQALAGLIEGDPDAVPKPRSASRGRSIGFWILVMIVFILLSNLGGPGGRRRRGARRGMFVPMGGGFPGGFSGGGGGFGGFSGGGGSFGGGGASGSW